MTTRLIGMKDWLNEEVKAMYYLLVVTGIIFGATLYQTMRNHADNVENRRQMRHQQYLIEELMNRDRN